MSEPTFAAGPWTVDWNDFLVRAKSPHDDRMVPVARPYGATENGTDVPGNARLIAAAPDMYEALTAAIECGMVPKSSVADGGASALARQVVVADMIRAARAKAEGKS